MSNNAEKMSEVESKIVAVDYILLSNKPDTDFAADSFYVLA